MFTEQENPGQSVQIFPVIEVGAQPLNTGSIIPPMLEEWYGRVPEFLTDGAYITWTYLPPVFSNETVMLLVLNGTFHQVDREPIGISIKLYGFFDQLDANRTRIRFCITGTPPGDYWKAVKLTFRSMLSILKETWPDMLILDAHPFQDDTAKWLTIQTLKGIESLSEREARLTSPTLGMPAKKEDGRSTFGIEPRTRRRYKIFREIEKQHPEYSQRQVAETASEEDPEAPEDGYKDYDVKNAHVAMYDDHVKRERIDEAEFCKWRNRNNEHNR